MDCGTHFHDFWAPTSTQNPKRRKYEKPMFYLHETYVFEGPGLSFLLQIPMSKLLCGGWRQGRLRLKIRRPLPKAGSGVFRILTGRCLPDSSNSSVPGTSAPDASQTVKSFFSLLSVSKFESDFGIVFWGIFCDFGAQNGGPNPSKIMKKSVPIPHRVPTSFFIDFRTKKERPGPSKT